MGSRMYLDSRRPGRRYSDDYEIGTLDRGELIQRTQQHPESGGTGGTETFPRVDNFRHDSPDILESSSSAKTRVLGRDIGPSGPEDEPTTRREGRHRYLQRHHVTGIAFSGTLGIGILVVSGQIIGLTGALGAVLCFLIAGMIVASVMLCLAEMVSVFPEAGLAYYPEKFVDPALGFAVGVIYWLAQTTSLATLIIEGALICGEISSIKNPNGASSYSPGGWLAIPLIVIPSVNFFSGIKLYGNLEWVIKWLKILFLVGLDITVIVLTSHGHPESGDAIGFDLYRNSSSRFSTFNPTLSADPDSNSIIKGSLGIFLSLWTGITLAMFAYLSVEIVIVTAGEAEKPVRDLPRASQRVYVGTIILYVVSIFIVSLNVSSKDTALQPLISSGNAASISQYSPFIIAIQNAHLKVGSRLIKAANAGLILTAWATANTALYAASRTLFDLCCKSNVKLVKQYLGKTNAGGTPLWAIGITFTPSLLALVSLKNGDADLVRSIFNRIATVSVLCVYVAECYAFTRFKKAADSTAVDRSGPAYKANYYYVPRQPFFAWFGICCCTLLIIFNGWYTFWLWQIRDRSTKKDSIGGFIGAYTGLVVFTVVFFAYKWWYKTRVVSRALCLQRFQTNLKSREKDETLPPNTGRVRTMAIRLYRFCK